MSIRDSIRRLAGESVVYGLGQFAGKGVQFVLVPVLVRALPAQEFGLNELLLAYAGSALLALVFGMDAALARFFYEQPDRQTRIRMLSSSLAFRLTTGWLAALALMALAGPLATRLIGGEVYVKYVRVAALTLPFTLVCLYSNDVLRVTFQPWKFIALNMTQAVTVGGLTLYFLLVRHTGVIGALYGKLLGDAFSAALGLFLCRHNLRFAFDRGLLRTMLAYGGPTVPAAIAYGVIGGVDRYALQHSGTLETVAVYGVASKFFVLVTLGLSAFQLAFGPFAYAKARESDAPLLYARVFAMFMAAASGAALAAGLAAPWIVDLLATRRYAGAAPPAMWLVFAAVAQGAYALAALGITLARRTALLSWTAGGAAVVAVVANAVLTPRFGAEGAAAATFCAYATSALLAYHVSQRTHRLPYRGPRLVLLIGTALALGLAVVHVVPPGIARGGASVAALLAYGVLVWRLGIWTDRGGVRHEPRPAASH